MKNCSSNSQLAIPFLYIIMIQHNYVRVSVQALDEDLKSHGRGINLLEQQKDSITSVSP